MNMIKSFSFEKSFACVQLFDAGDNRTRLFIQAIDAYSYQRELVIDFDSEQNKYRVHSYLHSANPIRTIKHVSMKVGKALIEQIIFICEKTPSSLFVESCPRNTGFVYFHTQLLAGATPSIDLL